MAAPSYVFSIARVARLLGEPEEPLGCLSVDDGLCIGLWAAKLHQKYMFARKVVGYTDFKDAL
jgi:hypothetical protein